MINDDQEADATPMTQEVWDKEAPKLAAVEFFHKAALVLRRSYESDAAFYFAAVGAYLADGKDLPTDEAEIAQLLGL